MVSMVTWRRADVGWVFAGGAAAFAAWGPPFAVLDEAASGAAVGLAMNMASGVQPAFIFARMVYTAGILALAMTLIIPPI
jgi:hypothetical protein